MKKETIVISLGGSLIVPQDIDVKFLRNFKKLVSAQKKQILIVTGGGSLARQYQKAGKQLGKISDANLDLLGIEALNLNAELVRILFGKAKNVKVFGAERPGQSTDWVAVKLAQKYRSAGVVNLSNTNYVYDSDPKKNPEAKKISKISWAGYRRLIPRKWKPGLNTPFDPVASKIAENLGIEVIIMNGKPLSNLKNYLSGKNFKGTVIK